ncbi:MAG: Peptide chain release factor 2 [Parcubacteria group bacterium GW2011_GWE2_39_37]|uniref:Peptide chain release factor 2 n=1 Tax=Candidatus Falkowbacteria bacterium GW2011_GWF2_39_8 TaxID=1618642 RepID=A0A0G0S8U1_9BACT|nr:MAG: Peptide chain release factor 2 [Parcubacteria group bacterium GW2011_GWE2_39_37]KKR31155.1 MAG: Peptide chain release factor 2 [Candidatus Falkowbacteria bacterium GW2011_GWF2_39_8]
MLIVLFCYSIIMENLLEKIEELREKLLNLWRLLDIDRQLEEINQLKSEMSQPSFWNDRERAILVGKRAEELEKETKKWQELRTQIRDLEEYVAEAGKEGDLSINEESEQKYNELKDVLAKFEFFVLFSGKYDRHNAIVSVHAGTGGVDAQDWTEILERMFIRFAEKRGWQVEVLDRNAGGEAGIKSSTLKISGLWAYGYLKSESGVHRLVRISPFDAEKMRHTSFALAEVIPEIADEAEIEIRDEDLKIDTYRASGPGGQNVNKTESAIRITHKPTGIIVACQTERSQHQNKETALKIIKSKLLKLQEEARETEEQKLKGDAVKADWGKQIRSYVMQPYQLVKDHRTNFETPDIKAVLDGELEGFMEAYLRSLRKI